MSIFENCIKWKSLHPTEYQCDNILLAESDSPPALISPFSSSYLGGVSVYSEGDVLRGFSVYCPAPFVGQVRDSVHTSMMLKSVLKTVWDIVSEKQ